MTDEPTPDEEGFNPLKFFEMLRKAASVKVGAIMLGEAQVAYYDSLKSGGMTDEQSYNMLAHTTDAIIRGVFASIPGVMAVVTRTAMISEAMGMGGKEVPGDGPPNQ